MHSSEVLMETLMFYLLIFIAVCQAACLVLLILTAGKNRKEKPDEPVKKDEYEDYLEKLWQEGVNGIMSYGLSNAAGKRRSDE